MRAAYACFFTLIMVACSTPSHVDRRADRIVKVCSAGLSQQTAARADALVARSGGTLSVGVIQEIRGAFLSDPMLSGEQKTFAYEQYLRCVKDGGVEVQKEDANVSIQRVQFSNNFRPANFFSSYDFIATFNRAYKNIGDRTIECRLRVRGVLKRRSSDSVHETSEVNERTFSIGGGQVYKADGEVGIKGFTDERYVVSTDDRLECWYR